MDKPLEEHIIQNRRLKLSGKIIAIVIFAVIALLLLKSVITPSLKLSRIRTAVVDRGTVQSTIDASGVILPEYEQVISSPFDTKVLKILKQPGAYLKSDESIAVLDTREIEVRLDRIRDEIALKENQKAQLQLELKQSLNELRTQLEILKVKLNLLEAKRANEQELYDKKMTTIWNLRQTEMDEEISRIEYRQHEDRMDQSRETISTRIEGLDIELRLLDNERKEMLNKMQQAEVRTDRSGVLTWVIPDVGASLRPGEVIARIADLSSWKISVSISDVNSPLIYVGMDALIDVNDRLLEGKISNIHPQVDNGIVSLDVSISSDGDRDFRSNQRVEVYLVTDRKANVLRVKKGPFAKGAGLQYLYLVRENRAYKQHVELGISSFETYEVVSGLQEGDMVVISDMRDYEHLDKIRIKR